PADTWHKSCGLGETAVTIAQKRSPTARGPPEKKAAPARVVAIQRQSRRAHRHFSITRARWKRFGRWSFLRRKFLGMRFVQSRHRHQRKQSGREACRLRPGRARGCGPVAKQVCAGLRYADNPDTIFLPQ